MLSYSQLNEIYENYEGMKNNLSNPEELKRFINFTLNSFIYNPEKSKDILSSQPPKLWANGLARFLNEKYSVDVSYISQTYLNGKLCEETISPLVFALCNPKQKQKCRATLDYFIDNYNAKDILDIVKQLPVVKKNINKSARTKYKPLNKYIEKLENLILLGY